VSDLKVPRQAFLAAMNEPRQLVPGEDAARGGPDAASLNLRLPWRHGIPQPAALQITSPAEILQRAEHDTEPEAGG
jgi:hypothetical protein